MPNYDFICLNNRCSQRGKKVTVVQKMTDDHTPPFCENCGSRMNRIFNSQETIFKGDGFTKSADAKEYDDAWNYNNPNDEERHNVSI